MKDVMDYPKTVEEAVDRLKRELTPEQQREIASMSERELMRLHFGLGMWIREHFGLWHEPSELLDRMLDAEDIDIFALDPDGASAHIIRAFWKHLQDTPPQA